MDNKEIYDNYLKKVKEVLIYDNFESMDYILEYIYTSGIPDETLNKIDNILQEITLYFELRDEIYKNEALNLIKNFEENINS